MTDTPRAEPPGSTAPARGPAVGGRPDAAAGAVTGLLTAAVALGVGQLAAGFSVPQGSPIIVVGQAAIDGAPQPLKTFAISAFGVDDKNVLVGGILAVIALFAITIGIFAVRRLAHGMLGLAAFASIGLAAALSRPTATSAYAVPTLVGAAAGGFALIKLARAAVALTPPPVPAAAGTAETTEESGPVEGTGPAATFTYLPGTEARRSAWAAGPPRRRFLTSAGMGVATAAVGTVAGRELITRKNVSQARAAVRLPAPAQAAPPLPAGSDLGIRGLSSFITPTSKFYRVDVDLFVPQVDPANWQLRIHGMVRREVTITFDQLLRRPLIEDYLTLTCVSDPVSGPYVGNAKWLGARLADLIRQAGPLAGADQLLCTSADGFTSGTPLQVVLDGRDALVAVAMNDVALPIVHGFPARLVVPGLYGYVSACKWVVDIKVTTFAGNYAYWAQRGWSQQAPIKTECRIDVPGAGTSLAAGRVQVAGVAWAQHKGIAAVEVRIDRGPWQQARLAAVPGIDTWRQWVYDWNAAPGSHLIEARATDETGYTQTAALAQPAPDGASGYPAATVAVRGA